MLFCSVINNIYVLIVMKKILTILILLITIAACKKDNKVKRSASIFGTWELRNSTDPFGRINQTFPPGNGNILQFNSDSTFSQRYSQSNVIVAGTFQVVKNPTATGRVDALFYNHNPQSQVGIYLRVDSLTIFPYTADGVSSLYIRK